MRTILKIITALILAFLLLGCGEEEGIMKNLDDQDVRKIEVIIEFDLPMKASDPSVAIQEGNLKGVGRFRYREDFYQGEFEKFD